MSNAPVIGIPTNMLSKNIPATWKEAGVIARVINTFLNLCDVTHPPLLKASTSENLYDRLGRSHSQYELKGDELQSVASSPSNSGDEEKPAKASVVADEQAEKSEQACCFSLVSSTTDEVESLHSLSTSSSQSILMVPLAASDVKPESPVRQPLKLPLGDTSTVITLDRIPPAGSAREACDQGSAQQRSFVASHDACASICQPLDRLQCNMMPSCVIIMPVTPCVTMMPTLAGRWAPIPACEQPKSQEGKYLTCTIPRAQLSGVNQRGVQSLTEQTEIQECTGNASQASVGIANMSSTNIMVKNMPSNTKPHEDGVRQTTARCVSPARKGEMDSVEKRLLKERSQDGVRRHLVVNQNIEELASRALPEATEKGWQRRLQKRHDIVAKLKGTPEYQAFSAHRRVGMCRASLRTPSPNDRSVSKRQWEAKIHKWREAVRNWTPN